MKVLFVFRSYCVTTTQLPNGWLHLQAHPAHRWAPLLLSVQSGWLGGGCDLHSGEFASIESMNAITFTITPWLEVADVSHVLLLCACCRMSDFCGVACACRQQIAVRIANASAVAAAQAADPALANAPPNVWKQVTGQAMAAHSVRTRHRLQLSETVSFETQSFTLQYATGGTFILQFADNVAVRALCGTATATASSCVEKEGGGVGRQ